MVAPPPLTDKDRAGDKDIAPDHHPAALRARLKHRAPPPEGASSGTYDTVRDTVRQLAELERLRAQDAAYIRTLEHSRATLVRDLHAAARAQAEADRAAAGERESAERRWRGEAEVAARVEAEVGVGRERERAERAEARVRALEEALKAAGERIVELEGAVERERKCREEWESGLEALALGGGSVVA